MLPSDLDTSAANKKQSIPPIRKETPYHQFSSKFIHIYSHSQVDTWANEVQGEGSSSHPRTTDIDLVWFSIPIRFMKAYGGEV